MTIRVLSYNCRGLRMGQSAGDKACRIVVDNLLENCDMRHFCEARLGKTELSLNDNFHGAGESTTDFGMGKVRGRISGGVAILWNKNLDS